MKEIKYQWLFELRFHISQNFFQDPLSRHLKIIDIDSTVKIDYNNIISACIQMPSRTIKQSLYAKNATRYYISKNDPSERFLKHCDAWFDAFVAEVQDEFPKYTTTQRRQEAEARWTIFAARSLKCPEADIRSWLNSASSRSIQ